MFFGGGIKLAANLLDEEVTFPFLLHIVPLQYLFDVDLVLRRISVFGQELLEMSHILHHCLFFAGSDAFKARTRLKKFSTLNVATRSKRLSLPQATRAVQKSSERFRSPRYG